MKSMASLIILMVHLAGFALPSCITVDQKVGTSVYPCRWLTVRKHDDTKSLAQCRLSHSFALQGELTISLPERSLIEIDEKERLVRCELGDPTAFHTDILPHHSVLYFDETQVLFRIKLTQPATLQKISFQEPTKVDVFPNGMIQEFKAQKGMHVQNMELKPKSLTRFYKTGGIHSCQLNKPTLVHGLLLGDEEPIQFYENGTLQRGVLVESATIQDLPVEKGILEFYPTHNIMQAHLATDASIQGFNFSKGSVVIFDEAGSLTHAEIPTEAPYMDCLCEKGNVYFYPNGHLKGCFLKEGTTFHGYYPCSRGYFMVHEDGKLRGCTLQQDLTVGGHSLVKGTVFCIDSTEKLVGYYYKELSQGLVDPYLIDGTVR